MKGMGCSMCAIAGILKLEFNKGIVDKMLATMLRRGPDDTGMFAQPEVCLLHTRLAVMDPARGAQPMETFWEGEQYVICYNGELRRRNRRSTNPQTG